MNISLIPVLRRRNPRTIPRRKSDCHVNRCSRVWTRDPRLRTPPTCRPSRPCRDRLHGRGGRRTADRRRRHGADRHRSRQRRRLPGVLHRVHGGATAVCGGIHSDGPAHPRRRCLLHLHREGVWQAHRAGRGVSRAAVLYRGAGCGVRLHRRRDQRSDHFTRRPGGAVVRLRAGDDGRGGDPWLSAYRTVRQGARRPAGLRGRYRSGH
jgi:hypothetical protein